MVATQTRLRRKRSVPKPKPACSPAEALRSKAKTRLLAGASPTPPYSSPFGNNLPLPLPLPLPLAFGVVRQVLFCASLFLSFVFGMWCVTNSSPTFKTVKLVITGIFTVVISVNVCFVKSKATGSLMLTSPYSPQRRPSGNLLLQCASSASNTRREAKTIHVLRNLKPKQPSSCSGL